MFNRLNLFIYFVFLYYINVYCICVTIHTFAQNNQNRMISKNTEKINPL
jgi:hypothetical protein